MRKGAGCKALKVPQAPMTSVMPRVPVMLEEVPDEHLGGIGGAEDADDAERRGVEDGPKDADGAAGVDDVGGVANVNDIGRDAGGGGRP